MEKKGGRTGWFLAAAAADVAALLVVAGDGFPVANVYLAGGVASHSVVWAGADTTGPEVAVFLIVDGYCVAALNDICDRHGIPLVDGELSIWRIIDRRVGHLLSNQRSTAWCRLVDGPVLAELLAVGGEQLHEDGAIGVCGILRQKLQEVHGGLHGLAEETSRAFGAGAPL